MSPMEPTAFKSASADIHGFRGVYDPVSDTGAPAWAVFIRDASSNVTVTNSKIHDVDGGGDGLPANTIGANRCIYVRTCDASVEPVSEQQRALI